jgi:hypothetical protein
MPVASTILQSEFLLQFQEQREDLTIPLAGKIPHNKDLTQKDKNGKK